MSKPLQGIRVLDLSIVLAGPFCCHQLAHLGAEVIKVEKPDSGDLARQLGADPELSEKHMGISFLAQNTGKKSITINLKAPSGKAILEKLVQTADVLVESFRPGVMKRLGLDFEHLKELNEELVYCAISGFGQSGPLSHLPAYDQIIQGMSGVMSITGDASSSPFRVGYPMADTISGLTAAFAISAALVKPKPGRGVCIDVSMLESVLATMGWVASNYLVAGKEPGPIGNDNFTASPSGSFRTGSGMMNIAANSQEKFESLCDVLEMTELKQDSRFGTPRKRLANRRELKEILETRLSERSAEEWEVLLNRQGVPSGRISSIPEILMHPQILDRGLVNQYGSVPEVSGPVRYLGTAVRLNGERPSTDRPPSRLGEHNQELLVELGYSQMEINRLKASKTI